MAEKCAFYRADMTFIELSDLRKEVVAEAIKEEKHWFDPPAKKIHLQENEKQQFGHLVKYWLGGIDSTIPPAKVEPLQNAAVDPTITYGNLNDAALNLSILLFNFRDFQMETKAEEVYQASASLDPFNIAVKNAEQAATAAKTAVNDARKKLENAKRQSGSGAAALVDQAKKAVEAANANLQIARDTLKTARDAQAPGKKAVADAKKEHEKAAETRKKRVAAAEKWNAADRANVLAALLTKASVTTSTTIKKKIDEALQAAHNSRADTEAWSAAFISSTIRAVSMKLKLDLLTVSRKHWKYVQAAIGPQKGKYQAFEPRLHKVEEGDLIATDRFEFIEKPIALKRDAVEGRILHVDIVVGFGSSNGTKFAETIGGNVGHSVRRRRYPLDAGDKLMVDRERDYVTQEDDGTFPAFAWTLPKTGMLPPRSTGRIIALLRLNPECKNIDPAKSEIEEGFSMSRFQSAVESPFLESDVLAAEEIEPRYELRGFESPFLTAELEQSFAELDEAWSEKGEEEAPAGSDDVIAFNAQTLPIRVAVLVTQAARQAREVEVLLFAHGYDRCGGGPKNRPVTFITKPPFRLGQVVEASGRPIVLVVPFLDWEHLVDNNMSFGSKWHKLALPKNMNAVVAEAMEKAAGLTGGTAPSIGELILAGHSRAYGVLDAMARLHADPEMSRGALAKLTHVWALDTAYTSPVEHWMKWLASRPDLRMTVIYRKGSQTGTPGERFRARAKESGGRMTVIPVPAEMVGHCAIPGHYLPELFSSLSSGAAPAAEEAESELYEYEQEEEGEDFALVTHDGGDDEVFEQTPESFDEAAEESLDEDGEDELDEGESLDDQEEPDEEAEDEFVAELDEEAEHDGVVVFPSGESLPIVTGLPVAKNEDYWDPTGSGNPLLDTGPAHKDKRLSADLTVRELTTTGGASADVARIDPKLIECVQRIRDYVGKPIAITSGFRSWKRNKQVYAARNRKPTLSQHCGGRAVDIKIAGMNGLAIGHAAIEAYGPNIGIGLANTFAHIDVRGVPAAWNYGGALDSWIAEIKQHQRKAAAQASSPQPSSSSPAVSTAPAVSIAPNAPPPLGGPKVPGPEYKKYRKGLARPGGGRLDATLTAMRQAGALSVSNADIDTLQRIANVETGGRMQALNTWDSAVVSIGFMQWTLKYGKLQSWIARAPAAFRKYGIELEPARTYTIGTEKVPAIIAAATTEELRWDGWAQRFYLAGLDGDAIVAEVDYATTVVLPEAMSAAKRWLKAIAGGFALFQQCYQGSLPLRGLFVEAWNNKPLGARNGLRNAVTRALREELSAPAEFYALMKDEILAAFVALNDRSSGEHIVERTSRLKL